MLALSHVSQNWWMPVLRGVVAIIFGLLALLWPGISLLVMVLFFGAYALVDGVLALADVVRGGNANRRWPLLLEGITGIIAGVLTFVWPGITALTLLFLIAAWAVVTGVFEIVQAVRLRRVITNEWLMIAAGVLSVLFGLGIAVFPTAGAVAIAWLIGIYAIAFGILLVSLGLRLRSHRGEWPSLLRRAA